MAIIRRLNIVLLLLALLSSSACALEMYSIDVQKADAHILLGDACAILVDTGSAQQFNNVLWWLDALGITKLDAVFLTHTDKDHAGGMMMLAQSDIAVDAWYTAGFCADWEEHPAYLAARYCGKEPNLLYAGDALAIGDLSIAVLAPFSQSEEENNNSLVLKVENADGSVLLAGDMLFEEEKEVLASDADLQADVLKVAHHGSKKSTSQAFLQSVQPKIAVISTSREKDAEVEIDADTYCTINGTVHVSLPSLQAEYLPNVQAQEDVADCELTVDAKDDRIEITFAQDTAFGGYILVSDKGGEGYRFAEDAFAKAGETIVIGTYSTDGAVDYLWPEKNVIHNKKQDTIYLVDTYSRIVAQCG